MPEIPTAPSDRLRGPDAGGAQPRAGWILDSRSDLLLFVVPPALIIPLAALLQRHVPVLTIAVLVAGLGSIGHHLPGLLRVYGDRELFDRFRTRFVWAPVALVALCLWFASRDLDGLRVVILVWGVWHGLMQVHGFLQIYERRGLPGSGGSPRLDVAMCITWFVGGILNSPGRMQQLFERFYLSGGPPVAGAAIDAFTLAWNGLTLTTTLVFVAHLLVGLQRGTPVRWMKLAIMASNFGFWWYAMGLDEVILGVAMFEVFHDIQYLGIVWAVNRDRLDARVRFARVVQALFRPRWFERVVYVALALGYGTLALASGGIDASGAVGLVGASSLLHFYYDGFIWKSRLANAPPPRATGLGDRLRAGFPHAAKWGLGAVLVGSLAFAESVNAPDRPRFATAIAGSFPRNADVHHKAGVMLWGSGRRTEGIEHLREAARLEPDNAQFHWNLGGALDQEGLHQQAIEAFATAERVDPEYVARRRLRDPD